MKKIFFAVMIMFAVLSFTACGTQKVRHDPEDYVLETAYKDDFKILQLSDIHMANKDNQDRQFRFLKLIIEDADADLIVVTGDIFTFADKATARRLFDFLDSFDTPWSVTFGNHDEQCYFPITWMTDYLNNYGSNCLFKDIQDDDVFGSSNFAINLTNDDGTVKEQVIIMDSNRYNYGEYLGYDYIKQDQIDWYERLVEYTTEQNDGKIVPSILMFHIPLPEWNDAIKAAENGDPDAEHQYGEMNEGVSSPKYNSGFFDKILELDSTKAIMVAHDHVDNLRVKYKGVILSYGLTSTDRIYYQEDMLGGTVVTIHDDNSLEYEYLYHTYEEVE